MRGHDLHPRASRRIRDHEDTAIDVFGHRLLQDGVAEDVLEDDQLARIEQAIATAEDARDQRRAALADDADVPIDVDYGADIAATLEPLQRTARRRVDELCAERCRVTIEAGDDWVARGHADADEVAAAQREARAWLLEHPDVCGRLEGGAALLNQLQPDGAGGRPGDREDASDQVVHLEALLGAEIMVWDSGRATVSRWDDTTAPASPAARDLAALVDEPANATDTAEGV